MSPVDVIAAKVQETAPVEPQETHPYIKVVNETGVMVETDTDVDADV